MSEQALREATVQFVRELCEPVGPFVFAGFGGRIARLRHTIEQAHGGDGLGGLMKADAHVRGIMRAWVDDAPLPATIEVLLDLFAAPPPEAGHDATDWRHELTELLYLCGRRDRAAVEDRLLARGAPLAPLAAELREWFDEEDPPAR